MDDTRAATGHRRIYASVATLAFTVGIVAAAVAHGPATPDATLAGLFGPPVVDLRLTGEHGIFALIQASNLAPGDVLPGTLILTTDINAPGSLMDLDIDARGRLEGWTDGPRLDKVLYFSKLSYGRDNLLSSLDGGRDLIREIDANPLVGNGNGRLDILEFDAGANDLPPPLAAGAGGTALVAEVAFDHEATRGLSGLPDQRIHLYFAFKLADTADADLN